MGNPTRDTIPDAPPGEELHDQYTPITLETFCVAVVQAWRELFDETPPISAVVLLAAQSAFECGWWKAIHCWNFGNAKAVPGGVHSWTYFACTEYVNGVLRRYCPKHPASCFRAFATMHDGMLDYLSLLKNRFGLAWPFILAGDVDGFVHALKQQRYFTDMEEHYRGEVHSIFDSLKRKLADFDPAAVPDYDPIDDATRMRAKAMVALSLQQMVRGDLGIGSPGGEDGVAPGEQG